MDGDDADESLNFMAVPNAEDPDNQSAAIVVKSLLPTDLLKFATDPASIDMTVVQLGAGLMLEGGFDEGTLNKLFQDETAGILNKDASATDPNMDPNGGQDPAGGPDMSGADAGNDGSADPNDPLAQLEILGRIMAAGLMQTEHCMNLLEDIMGVDPGTGAEGGATADDGSADATAAGSADPSGDPPPDASADAGSPADGTPSEAGAAPGGGSNPPDDKKNPKPPMGKVDGATLDLAKRVADENEALRKRVEDLTKVSQTALEKLEEFGKQPAPPKGALMATPLSKAADTLGGGSDVVTQLAAEYRAQRDETGRQKILLKGSFKGINASDILEKVA
jgi:hypothetical protein